MYKTALISFGTDKTLHIKYRQFMCEMNPVANEFVEPQIINHIVHSSIRGINESINSIFEITAHKNILYCYGFPVRDDYNKQRECH